MEKILKSTPDNHMDELYNALAEVLGESEHYTISVDEIKKSPDFNYGREIASKEISKIKEKLTA